MGRAPQPRAAPSPSDTVSESGSSVAMQLTVAVSAVLDRLRAVLTRHSDAPVALLLPRETFLLTDWGRHRRQQQPEEYSVRTLPYASNTGTVIDSTKGP